MARNVNSKNKTMIAFVVLDIAAGMYFLTMGVTYSLFFFFLAAFYLGIIWSKGLTKTTSNLDAKIGAGTIFSASLGMYFKLERSAEIGCNWSPIFSENEFQLIETKLSRSDDNGRESDTFTFNPLKRGLYGITLTRDSAEKNSVAEGTLRQRFQINPREREIKFNVIVK